MVRWAIEEFVKSIEELTAGSNGGPPARRGEKVAANAVRFAGFCPNSGRGNAENRKKLLSSDGEVRYNRFPAVP